VIVWRVLPVDPAAADDAAGGPLWFPREYQGAARHDNPSAYGCLYVAEAPVSAVAEALAAFRGRGALTSAMLERAGRRLSLVALELREPAGLLDLDEPQTLAAEGLRPSGVATRVRATTQRDALALFETHRRATGLRWWSTIEASWINVTVFDRARRRLRMRSVELLSPDHEAVRGAASELGLA
jgi:RES domain